MTTWDYTEKQERKGLEGVRSLAVTGEDYQTDGLFESHQNADCVALRSYQTARLNLTWNPIARTEEVRRHRT